MNRLSPEKREAVVEALSEGNSLRATSSMTGVARNSVSKLLVDLGVVCSVHQGRAMRDLPCKRIQCDEIWSFVGMKQKNVPVQRQDEALGDVWTWVALDADTKLVPTYRVGSRGLADAQEFIADLAKRLRHRVQLTTDGNRAYLTAVERTFQGDVDYAMLVKLYGQDGGGQGRYSPPTCLGAVPERITGEPDLEHVSTSYVERQNLTMRMSIRRFTPLTNAFSKRLENLAAAVSLHFMHYNYCRVHNTLKTTPAVAAGITDHVWAPAEIVALLDEDERVPTKRGPYRPRAPRSISN